MAQPHFEIYPERGGFPPILNGRWRWRFIAANGENTANGSEGYDSEGNVRRAVHRHCEHVMDACGVTAHYTGPKIIKVGK